MGANLETRFARYVEAIVAALGHADRVAPATWYLQGLMLPADARGPVTGKTAHSGCHCSSAWTTRVEWIE